MAATLSNYTSALKEILLPYIRDNFPKEVILLDKIKQSGDTQFINDEFITPLRSSRHGGVAALANDGNNVVTNSNGASTTRGTIGVKTISGAFDISKLAIDASANSQGAVEPALKFQTETLLSDFKRSINRMYYNDGRGVVSQVLGSVSGTEASLMYPDANLQDASSIDWYGTVNGDIAIDKYLTAGNLVGIGSAGTAHGTISSLTGTSMRLTGATGNAANENIVIEDGSNGNGGTSEIVGIRAALSSSTGTSTYAGVARNTTGWAPQFGSVSEAITQSRMERTYLNAREYAMTGDKFIILVNKTLYAKYGDILTSLRRTVNETELIGGYSGLSFAAGAGKVGVFLDYDVPDGEVLFINLDTWALCQVKDIDWFSDPNGGGLLRIQNSIKYQATLVWFLNLMCLAPAANGRLTQKVG